MNTKQPEALRLANILRGIDARSLFANEKLSAASAALENQHARITGLESQLAQRFDAADMATAAAQGFRDGGASLSANAGEPRNAIDRDALIDAIAQGLHGTWHCTRVWEAWHVGTMSQDDFEPVDESETPTEIADAVLALLATPPTAQAEGWQSIETAPRDGQAILVTDGWDCYCVEWDEEFDWWTVDDNKLGPFRLRGSAPTHWMKLPAAPTSGAADLPEALRRYTAADGKTELFNLPGYPLMVRAVDFNRIHAESEMRRAALLDEMQKAALAAGQATAAQAVVPAGWKLVPLDATDEMVRATDEVNFENGDTDGTIHNVWHVMIAAAPAQPAAQPSRFGSPELQAMIIARCVEKDRADSVPAGGYPPLPNLDSSDEPIWEAIFNWKTATHGADAGRKANKVENAIIETMRAYVDADRAARAPADSVLEDAAREDIEKVLALFPFNALIQKFSVNNGPCLTADNDDEFYSVKRVLAFLTEIKTTLDAARKQGANHDR